MRAATEISPAKKLNGIIQPLLKWYDANARTLPWRSNTEPYGVWVSEIMLQQTQVDTVIPYYLRFMRAFPDITSLAEADEEKLLKLWEGLGYYARVRNMQKTAQLIKKNFSGKFPDNYADILPLPGIGPYTAGAIASICFGERKPAVDGNVLRVVARLTAYEAEASSSETKHAFTQMLSEIYPHTRCGDFTQSLMELGAVVCIANGMPKCTQCPLMFMCGAYANDKQMLLPIKKQKMPRKKETKTVFLLRHGDMIAVKKRGGETLLRGLWEFPNACGDLPETAAARVLAHWGVSATAIKKSMHKKHLFTHIEWEMSSYIVDCETTAGDFVWMPKSKLHEEVALPSAFRDFLNIL